MEHVAGSPDSGTEEDAVAQLAEYARQLVGAAGAVRVGRLSIGIPFIEITPRRPGARSVSVIGEQGIVLEVENTGGARWELPYSAEGLDFARRALEAVVDGSVEVRTALARSQVVLTFRDGSVHETSGFDGLGGLLPLPGWRQRAVTQARPYS